MVSYGTWQKDIADNSVRSDLTQAMSSLKSYKNFNNNYPPNLAGTGFASSQDVALVLYTNAESHDVYEDLTSDQNAQLFLNVCNAGLESTNNTACVFNGTGNGAKIHVKGTEGANMHWRPSPITVSYLMANCDSICTQVTTMISQFEAQGGTLPIAFTGAPAALPEPVPNASGPATAYCLNARSGSYPDVVYHVSSENTAVTTGACPPDPDLKYFP